MLRIPNILRILYKNFMGGLSPQNMDVATVPIIDVALAVVNALKRNWKNQYCYINVYVSAQRT